MKRRVFILLGVMFFILTVAAVLIGSVRVGLLDIGKILSNHLFGSSYAVDGAKDSIIFDIRLPRVIVTILVGCALSTSGAVIQGVYRNPMADTGVLGISSGASLGAIIAIATGLVSVNIYAMPAMAAVCALLTAFGVFFFSSRKGKVPVLTLVLAGIAISTFLRAMVSLILSCMEEGQMKEYLYWSMGSLSSTRWEHVKLAVLPVVIGCGLLMWHSKELNILMLGEEEAQSLGLNPYKIRKRLLFLVSLVTAIAVCVSGGIQFVGLVIPHMIRLTIGADNKILIPASALGGACFLLLCDLFARTLVSPAEIAVGIVTAVIGAPYFLYLIHRQRKGQI